MHIVFSGKVQGVGFRFHARQVAQDLGLIGWAANEADRTVVCEVQGNIMDVDAFYDQMKDGPPLSRVYNAHTTEIPLLTHETSFEIIY